MRVLCDDGKVREIVPSQKDVSVFHFSVQVGEVKNSHVPSTSLTYCLHCRETFGYEHPKSDLVKAHVCDRRFDQEKYDKMTARKGKLYGK